MISKRQQTQIKKKVSNADRSQATSRAKRDAAVNARRGLRSSGKATKMEIEQQVQKQANQTAIQKANQQNTKKKATHIHTNAQTKKQEREILRAGQKAAKAEHVTLKPTKKQLQAAREAMIDAGYVFPPAHVIDIVPKPKPPKATTTANKQQQQQPNKKNNNNKRGAGAGGSHKK